MSDREAEYHGWLLREVLFDNGEPIAHREPAAPTPYTEADCLAAEKKWSAPAAPTVVEPVAFVNAKHLQGLTLGFYGYAEIYTDESAGRVPLYTAPPRPAPALTDEEIRDLWSSLCVTPPPPPPPAALTDEEMKQLWKHHGYKSALCMRFARAIEAAHGIGEPK